MKWNIQFVGLPEPDQGLMWCAVCVAAVKGRLCMHPKVAEQLEQFKTYDGDKPFVIAVPAGFKAGLIEPAVTVHCHDLLGGLPVPVCWTHCTGIDPNARPAPPQQSRGLIVGSGPN